LKVRFYYDDVNYRINRSTEIKDLIVKVIRSEKKIPGDLCFIFTGDEKIRELNVKYLDHDYFTDVIAFDYAENRNVNGEVYISIDQVRKNSINYKVSLNNEVLRVIIHATLHLCGMDDKTVNEKNLMRKMEDKWIKKFGFKRNGIQI